MRDLVLDSDLVVVPGLGTFRAEVVPASFSDKGYTVNPPYRKLTFVVEELPEAKVLEAEGLAEFVEQLKKELKMMRPEMLISLASILAMTMVRQMGKITIPMQMMLQRKQKALREPGIIM